MPLAYTAAPIPAAAVLSGAAVKAGVIFVRFIPFQQSLPGWGAALAAAGLFSAFYGVRSESRNRIQKPCWLIRA